MMYTSLGGGGASSKFRIEVVDTLPIAGEASTFYLVPEKDAQSPNLFTEYLYVNGAWEKLGSQSINLADFYTKEQTDAKFATAEKVADVDGRTWVKGEELEATDYNEKATIGKYEGKFGSYGASGSQGQGGIKNIRWDNNRPAKILVHIEELYTGSNIKTTEDACAFCFMGAYGRTYYTQLPYTAVFGVTGDFLVDVPEEAMGINICLKKMNDVNKAYTLTPVNTALETTNTKVDSISEVLEAINGETELENIDSVLDSILEEA